MTTGRRRATSQSGLLGAIALLAVIAIAGGCARPLGGSSPSPIPSPNAGPSGDPTAGHSGDPNAGPAGLVGREFLSTAVTDGGKARPLIAGTRIRLTFRQTDLGVSAGCNLIGGQWRLEAGRLEFTGAVMTEMACPDGRDAQDAWLIAFLGERPTLELRGSELTLTSGGVVIRLLDREIAEPDLPLTGVRWVVVGIVRGDVASSLPGEVAPSLRFAASGSVDVQTGCNQGSGRWTERDGRLQVTDLVLTKKACGPAEGEVESAVLTVLLAPTLAYEIDAAQLTLTAGPNGLMLGADLPA